MKIQQRISRAAFFAACMALFVAAAGGAENFLPETSRFIGEEVWVPMRDGKRLAADLYLPKTAKGPLPVILIQTPYNKGLNRGGFKNTPADRRQPLSGVTDCVLVFTDWRGRYASTDALTPTSTPGGPEDGFDTISWVVAQPWCNGKVGTWGPSALGRVQFATAKAHHPNHVCAVPFVMPLNLTYESYFPGGALGEDFVNVLKRLGWDRRGWLTENPVNNEFWRDLERTTFTKPSDIQIPMLIYGGWFDIYTDGVIETYQAIKSGGGASAREQTRLIMGPWIHAGNEPEEQGELVFENAAGYGAERAVAFLEHQLHGTRKEEDSRALVTYYQMGANEWRTSAAWPPPGAKEVSYHLTHEKSLLAGKPPNAQGSVTIKADPANPVPSVGGHLLGTEAGRGPMDQRAKVEGRADVAVFSTEVLEHDLPIAGAPRVELQVATDGPDTDFVALLTDVYPDGRSMLIGEGIKRLRFREGTEKEVLAEPGKIYSIGIKLQSTAITFKKGHRARLIMAPSSAPHWAVNPNDGGKMYDGHAGRIAANTIHTGAEHNSRLILPVVHE